MPLPPSSLTQVENVVLIRRVMALEDDTPNIALSLRVTAGPNHDSPIDAARRGDVLLSSQFTPSRGRVSSAPPAQPRPHGTTRHGET